MTTQLDSTRKRRGLWWCSIGATVAIICIIGASVGTAQKPQALSEDTQAELAKAAGGPVDIVLNYKADKAVEVAAAGKVPVGITDLPDMSTLKKVRTILLLEFNPKDVICIPKPDGSMKCYEAT